MEKEMANHSSTLAWKIPWMEEPGRLQSMGSLKVRHDWATSLSLFTFMYWARKWQPIPVFLPGESQGQGSLVGCRLWGHRVGHDWSDLAAAHGIFNLYHGMWDLAPWPGIESVPPAFEAQRLSNLSTRKVPWLHFWRWLLIYLPPHMLILQCDGDEPPWRGEGLTFPPFETGWTFEIGLTDRKGQKWCI